VADTLVIGAGCSVVIAETVPGTSVASQAATTITTAATESTTATTSLTTIQTPLEPVPVDPLPVTPVSQPATSPTENPQPLSALTPSPAAADAVLALAVQAIPEVIAIAPVALIAQPAPQAVPTVAIPTSGRRVDSAALDHLALLVAWERSATELSAQRHLRALDTLMAEGRSFLAESPDMFATARPVRRRMGVGSVSV
jgi:hypothetical protein